MKSLKVLFCASSKLLRSKNNFLKTATRTSQVATQNTSQIQSYDEDDKFVPLNPFGPASGELEKRHLDNLAPVIKQGYNFAAYVNHVDTLQCLVKLGVSLFDIENLYPGQGGYLIALDFQRDCIDHIKFLMQTGLDEANLGRAITQFPTIFKESVENLQIRVNYLESRGFTAGLIKKIINQNAYFFSQKVRDIDVKLGQLQTEYRLPDRDLRRMVSNHPDVVLIPHDQHRLINNVLSREFGFEDYEVKQIVVRNPEVTDINRIFLVQKLDLIHNILHITHEQIAKFPSIITAPATDLRHRFAYLQKLNRNQFDASKPLYVPPFALYEPDNLEFCIKYAKTDLDHYKMFLKEQ